MALKDSILFPATGKIDTDSALLYVKKGDIIDAMNCRWGMRNDGTVNAVENVRGNLLLNSGLPEGNNKVIGACNDYPNNRIIFFIYNDKNLHSIYQLNMVRRAISPILYKEPILNFNDGYIMNAHVINNGLLIWLNTDGVLKNLIIEKAQKYTYEKYHIGVDYWETNEYVVQP